MGVVTAHHLNNLSREKLLLAGGVVADYDRGLSPFLQHNEHASVHHRRNFSLYPVVHIYGLLHHPVCRYINEQTIMREHGVELDDRIALVGHLSIVR